MYSTMHTPLFPHNINSVHHYNNYHPMSSSDEHYVLDLSTKPKRALSPDYTYCYPSPKASPNKSFEENTSLKCYNELTTNIRTITPPQEARHTEISLSQHSSSPHSIKSIDALSETISEVSCQSDVYGSPKIKKRMIRPFKTLEKDPFSLAAKADPLSQYSMLPFLFDEKEFDPQETKVLMEESAKKYHEFKDKMLHQLGNNKNNTTNQNMRRSQNNGSKINDPEYVEKRKKNNEAAKRSRDARRSKQDEIAIRATFLEQENIMLRYKIQSEIKDLERLKKMGY